MPERWIPKTYRQVQVLSHDLRIRTDEKLHEGAKKVKQRAPYWIRQVKNLRDSLKEMHNALTANRFKELLRDSDVVVIAAYPNMYISRHREEDDSYGYLTRFVAYTKKGDTRMRFFFDDLYRGFSSADLDLTDDNRIRRNQDLTLATTEGRLRYFTQGLPANRIRIRLYQPDSIRPLSSQEREELASKEMWPGVLVAVGGVEPPTSSM